MYMYTYIHIHTHILLGESRGPTLPPGSSLGGGSLEYGTPRSHSPVASRRFPEIFGDFCKNETGFL